jgi:hypothetical protein
MKRERVYGREATLHVQLRLTEVPLLAAVSWFQDGIQTGSKPFLLVSPLM